ncbi:MAG: hypothetical protein KAT16_11205, partial [Candidatus Heimdallarchaeota archaeon]|nr:hypothetical protein [Candidatus Heimdallarchaeota archaeon]
MAMASEKAKTKTKKKKDYILVRSYPETLFFYPSMLVAILSFFIQSANPTLANELGTFFFAVFAFNFIIVAFDFGIGKTALIAFGVIILVLIMILLQQQLGDALNFSITLPNINVSNDFYFFFSILMIAHFILIYIYSRIDYWMISPTEIYHHRGILGDERRFGNAQHAHIEKTTPDIFEKMLFLSGDLFIKPETDPH